MYLKTNTHSETSWRALQYFNLYRFLIAFLFVMLIWVGRLPTPLGSYDQFLFSVSSHLYFLLTIIIAFFIKLQIPRYNLQIAMHMMLDILAISLMMFASNGVSSGLGVLLVIAVLGGNILRVGRIAILFAAIAALIVLGQEVYVQFFRYSSLPNYTHAGFLGITFFMTAFLGQVLASKVQESEALAEQRAIDLENLGLLNEYIVQRMQSGLVVLDDNYQIRLLNESARRLLGLVEKDYHKKLERSSPELFKYLSNWGQDDGQRTVIFRPEKGDIEVQASFTRLNPESKFGVLIFLEDVAQIRQHAQNLKVASLGRLSASIAHEVRNPLGAISHASQLLSESESLGKGDERLINIIVDHANRVNRIIENMMRISRREAAVPESININEWMQGFISEFTSQKQLEEIDIHVGTTLDNVFVRMDVTQLHQVVWNLSENALRYSQGRPLIEYQWGLRESSGKPYLDVIDHGSGMSEDAASQLFEPFFTTDVEGSGLGLYISRELCEANQASLMLEQNTSMGCCFRIHFAHIEKRQDLS
jgi:two-component system sensor histidine kinase PilS (NtrC family)